MISDYSITEKENKWELINNLGKVNCSISVSKKDCPTKKDLEEYIKEVGL